MTMQQSRRVVAPKKPKTKLAAKQPSIFDSEIGRAAMASFDEQMKSFALEESELGKQARLALRLKRDHAPEKKIKQAIRPFMFAYVKLIMAPENNLEKDGRGNFVYPIVLPKKARKAGKEAAHAN
jgi:hypothetical protein